MSMSVSLHRSMYTSLVLRRSEERGVGSPGTRARDDSVSPCHRGAQNPNPGSLEEQPELLTTEHPPHPLSFTLRKEKTATHVWHLFQRLTVQNSMLKVYYSVSHSQLMTL